MKALWVGGLVLAAAGVMTGLVFASAPPPAGTEAAPSPGEPPDGVRASVVAVHGGLVAGTGFVLDDSGHILTTHRAITGDGQITVTVADGRQVPAQVVGGDAGSDLAVLRIADAPPPLRLGDPARVRVGDDVMAVGTSVSSGVVTAVGKQMRIGGVLRAVLRTDAAVGAGNSGGPLVNVKGEVIGVNTVVASSGGAVGFGFVTPIDIAEDVAGRIIG